MLNVPRNRNVGACVPGSAVGLPLPLTPKPPTSIWTLFQRQVALRPNAVAVRCAGRRLTYRELNSQANAFAASLVQVGVQRHMLVGIFMDRSFGCLAAMLGIWKAGAAYLGLDPSSPPDRLAFVLEDADVSFIVAERKLEFLLPSQSRPVLFADDLLAMETAGRIDSNFSIYPDDLAYVLYTSGSTGRPKGVEVCHGGLANVLSAISEELQLTPDDVLLGHTSLGFDVSNLETYLPLISGGSLYLAATGRVGDAAKLSVALEESGATTMLGTCTLWRLLLDTGWRGKPDLRAISGGEVLPLTLAKALASRTAAVWNQYGPTEASICTTTVRIDPTAEEITIGHAISNTTVHVLDSKLQPVPTGQTGELYIGGVGVARGYRNRPELTAVSFLADPFSQDPQARLYKTGDLGFKLPDGRLQFCGRVDSQVKIHGYRIELEEIEQQICLHPGICAAAVAAVDRGEQDQRIVAWFESRGTIAPLRIREFLRKRLPAYMVPSEFRRVESMPLSESGKIDRKALAGSAFASDLANVPEAATEAESQLRSIFEDLLQIHHISLTDSFFDLGGDSLLATLLVLQIETRFGKRFSPDVLLECPDIKTLAARIAMNTDQTLPVLVPLRAAGSNPPLFIVEGLGGNVSLFRSLVAHLNEDQPVYGVSLPSGVVHDRDEVAIKTMAAKSIEEILRIAPSGPYNIAGYSFGSLIAFEIVAQLTRRGEQVGLLALIDGDRNLSKRADAAEQLPSTPGLVLRRYQAKLKSLTEKGVAEVFRRRVEHIKLQKRVKLAQRAADTESSGAAFQAKELMVLAGRDYTPAVYRGSAVLFRAMDEVRDTADRDLGWAELTAGGLQIVDIPGEHLTIFDEPNVQVFAKLLTDELSSQAILDRHEVQKIRQ